MQLIDKLVFECPKTGYRADIEFHGKVGLVGTCEGQSMFGGESNRVTATIAHNGEVIHHLHGHWDSVFYLSDAKKQNVGNGGA